MDGERGSEIEMVVESVRVHMLSSRHVVILKETERDRYLPIWIGPWEASAIAMQLQGLTPERPLTHDLFADRARATLGVRVERVVISDARRRDVPRPAPARAAAATAIEIDARPSDALALAVRLGVPIFASRDGPRPGGARRRTTTTTRRTRARRRARRPGGAASRSRDDRRGARSDPRSTIFRDFVNSLDPDSEQRGGGCLERAGRRAESRDRRSVAQDRAAPAAGARVAVRPHPQAQAPEVRTARKTTDGLAPVGEPAVRG